MASGSLVNHLSGTAAGLVPTVGMGATELCYTDRNPYTVIEVSKSGKTVRVQADGYTRTDNNGMSECQSYDYAPDPNGEIVTLRKNKRGQWVSGRRRFALGYRQKYHDFSF